MGNLLIVDFKNKKLIMELNKKDLSKKYKLDFENLIYNFHKTYNINEIKKFNFKNNYKLIKFNIKIAS